MFKHSFLLLTAITLWLSSPQYTYASCLEGEVEVDDQCVDSNKVHYVQPGKPNALQSSINEANNGDYIILKAGNYELTATDNKTALLIKNKKSLKVFGEDKVRLTTKQSWVTVLMLDQVENITLQNLELTHEVKRGSCEGAVVKLLNAKNINFTDAIFNGSGTFAVQMDHAQQITLNGGQAINNTEGVFYIKNSQEVTITGMQVVDNDNSGASKNGILDVEGSNSVFFTSNVLKHNHNDYFKKIVESRNVEIDGNEFVENSFRLYDASGIDTTRSKVPNDTVSGEILWSQAFKVHPDSEWVLEWLGDTENQITTVRGVKIYNTVADALHPPQRVKESKPIQVIRDLEIATKVTGKDAPIYSMEDVNFDGYQDLRILISSSIANTSDNVYYRFWLFDPTVGSLVENSELKALIAPVIDNEHQQIISTWKGSQGGRVNYGTDYYQFINDQLVLIRQELQNYTANGVYQLTVKKRVGEELKVVEQRMVHEEDSNPPAPVGTESANLIKQTWQGLAKLFENPDDNSCPVDLTQLPEKGIRGFYCHIQPALDYAKLAQLAQLPVFSQGPHTNQQLNWHAVNEFGYYRKEFVQWLIDNMIPAAKVPALKELTQPGYNQYVRRLARTFYEVYKFWQDHPEYLAQEQQRYLALLTVRQVGFCGDADQYQQRLLPVITAKGYDTEETLSAAKFWLRRSIDGTAELWRQALSHLLEIYDADFMKMVADEWWQNYLQFRQFISPIVSPYCQLPKQVLLYSTGRGKPLITQLITPYPSLMAAIQDALPGEIIWLCPGVYEETINIDGRKNLLIYGDQASLITRLPGHSLININQSQYVDIAGLRLVHEVATTAAENTVQVTDSNHIQVCDNEIEGGYYGIGLSQVQPAEITGNRIHFTQHGVGLTQSSQVLLKYNRFFDNVQNDVTWSEPSSISTIFRNDWATENELHPPKTLRELLHLEAIEPLANSGEPLAQLALALSWYQDNNVEAAKWFQAAATQGEVKAQYYLGGLYYEGQGVAQEYTQAATWFEQAAKQGYAKAQNALGGLYYEGKGVPQDFTQAGYWARKAALQGDAKAQNNLASLYCQGLGVAQDLVLATHWATQAAKQGHIPAQNWLKEWHSPGKRLGTSDCFNNHSVLWQRN